ncbi:MAG: helicase HerA-like domain-containing protein, partial [Gammaproteobacteria bacterium]
LLSAIEQVVRLIRSKGVGVYFVTQNPDDVPETVLGQLGNRVQHALRAFTPRDQKAIKAAAETFRQNPSLDTAAAITELAVGEALVSMLDSKGNPEIVARSLIAPPMARVGTISDEERERLLQKSGLLGKYETAIDRPSAFEALRDGSQPGDQDGASRPSAGGLLGAFTGALGGFFKKASAGGGQRMSTAEIAIRSAVQSAARAAGTQIGREILRGILGGKSKK